MHGPIGGFGCNFPAAHVTHTGWWHSFVCRWPVLASQSLGFPPFHAYFCWVTSYVRCWWPVPHWTSHELQLPQRPWQSWDHSQVSQS
jgi:hypothetical protein